MTIAAQICAFSFDIRSLSQSCNVTSGTTFVTKAIYDPCTPIFDNIMDQFSMIYSVYSLKLVLQIF